VDRAKRPEIGAPEAARRLGLTRQAVGWRLRQGKLAGAHRLSSGARWRIDEATFEAWRRALGDPNAKPASAFDVDPLPFKAEGDAA
jgi:hypothetical protein